MSIPVIAHADLGHNNSTSTSSLVINVGFSVAHGDTVVVAMQKTAIGVGINSVTDTQGNTYTEQGGASVNNAGFAGLRIWMARIKFPLTNTDTITITPASAASIAAQAIHITGAVASNNPPNATLYDVAKTGTGSATNAPTTGASATLAKADELSLGFVAFTGNTGGFSAESAGYTSQATIGNANGSLHWGSKNITASASPGTETYAPTLTGSPANYAASVLTLRGPTTRYVDTSAGSDANSGLVGGGGTPFANAKLTIAASGALAGDVVHVAKTPTPSASAGTSTWTSGSTTVSTTSDLTGSIAAKDLVSTTADGSGGYWEVSAITSTTITLVTAYRPGPNGLTGSGLSLYALTSAGGGYIGFNTAGNIQATPAAGTQNDPIQIIGGYDTTSDTRTGMTWNANTNATRQGIFNIGNAYNNLSYLGLARTARAFSNAGGNSNPVFDHCQVASSAGECFYHLGSGGKWTNCVAQPQSGNGAFTQQVGTSGNVVMDTCVALSTGSADAFFTLVAQSQFINCAVDGTTGIGFKLNGRAGSLYNCTANHTGTGIQHPSTAGVQFEICNCSSSNATSRDFQVTTSVDGTPAYYFNTIGNSGTVFVRTAGDIYIDKYQQTNGDYRYYSIVGAVVTNTSQGRSGTCTEIQPGQGLNANSDASTNADFLTRVDRYVEQDWPIPVESGGSRTVTVYVKKSSTWDGDGIALGLKVNGYWAGGTYPTNYAVNSDSNPMVTTSYQQYTFTYDNSAGPDQVIELCINVNGSAGSVYVDDVSWT